jgi:hypothetical protein
MHSRSSRYRSHSDGRSRNEGSAGSIGRKTFSRIGFEWPRNRRYAWDVDCVTPEMSDAKANWRL